MEVLRNRQNFSLQKIKKEKINVKLQLFLRTYNVSGRYILLHLYYSQVSG